MRFDDKAITKVWFPSTKNCVSVCPTPAGMGAPLNASKTPSAPWEDSSSSSAELVSTNFFNPWDAIPPIRYIENDELCVRPGIHVWKIMHEIYIYTWIICLLAGMCKHIHTHTHTQTIYIIYFPFFNCFPRTYKFWPLCRWSKFGIMFWKEIPVPVSFHDYIVCHQSFLWTLRFHEHYATYTQRDENDNSCGSKTGSLPTWRAGRRWWWRQPWHRRWTK